MTRRQNRMFFKIGFAFLGAAVLSTAVTYTYHYQYGISPHIGNMAVIAISIMSMISLYLIFGLGILPRLNSFFFLYNLGDKNERNIFLELEILRFITVIIDDPFVREDLSRYFTIQERIKAGLD